GDLRPFLRLGTNADTEQGYNTSAGFPLDDKPPLNFTHALNLVAVPIVNIAGINYREFLLDANQVGDKDISLNQVQIFQTASDVGLTFTPNPPVADATHNAVISFPGFPGPVFQMSNLLLSGTSTTVLINSGNGSGTADFALYVRDSLFVN